MPKPKFKTPETPADMPRRNLEITYVPIGSLKPDPENPNTHGAKNLEIIEKSTLKWGVIEPLLVQKSTGIVINGNGRLERWKKLGLKSVPVNVIECTDNERKSMTVDLNRTGQTAELDTEKVAEIMAAAATRDDGTQVASYRDEEVQDILDELAAYKTSQKGGDPHFDITAFDTNFLEAKTEQAKEKAKRLAAEQSSSGNPETPNATEPEPPAPKPPEKIKCPHCGKKFTHPS